MEASSSTAQQNSPQGNTNDQVSDDVNALPLSFTEESKLPKEMEENRLNSRQGNINDQVSVDINALTSSLKEELEQLHPISEERCMYRVPKRLRVLNEKSYTPRCVSIGPYHHGKYELRAMEEHKTMYLKIFLKFSKVSLERFVSCVRDNETRLRNCYQERIDLSSERFVRLMLVDAAFLIVVIGRICLKLFLNENDLFFNKPYMIHDIRNDMILLENQLPLFILHELLVLSNLVDEHFSMVKLCSDFLGYQFPLSVVNPEEELNFSACKHLVDFLRIGQQPSVENRYRILDAVNLPSVMELHLAGVKFKRGSNLRLMEINFRDGMLVIPPLQLNDSTEILFRNLQAFELCQIDGLEIEGYFNDYIAMISMLVTNGKDVEILTKEGIIENWLHDNEQVVHLLHNLGKENLINKGKFYFSDVVNDLNQYCRKKTNRWMASLIQTYFHNPWSVISVIAAVYIILLTTIQTICSILQVKQKQ